MRAITYKDENGNRRIYLFNIAKDRSLETLYSADGGKSFEWANQYEHPNMTATPDKPIESVAAVSHLDGGKQRIYVFTTHTDGHLWVNYWNGVKWDWRDQGMAIQGYEDVGGPGAVSYEHNGKRYICAYVVSGGELYVNEWDGTKWLWKSLGRPEPNFLADSFPGSYGNVVLMPAAFSCTTAGERDVYIFPMINLGNVNLSLCSCRLIGLPPNEQPVWKDHSIAGPLTQPVGYVRCTETAAINYIDEFNYENRIYVFATHDQEKLHLSYSADNGENWKWSDRGSPKEGASMGSPHVFSFRNYNGKEEIHAFVVMSESQDSRLYYHRWNGSNWQWREIGSPSSDGQMVLLGALTYTDDGSRYYRIFVRIGEALWSYRGSIFKSKYPPPPTWQRHEKPQEYNSPGPAIPIGVPGSVDNP